MPFECKDGETPPCTFVQDVSSKTKRVRNTYLLTNGWTFNGTHFKKRGEKSRNNYYKYMSEAEEDVESDDDLSGIGPPPSDDDEPSGAPAPAKAKAKAKATATAPATATATAPAPATATDSKQPLSEQLDATKSEQPDAMKAIFYEYSFDKSKKIETYTKTYQDGKKMERQPATPSIHLPKDSFMECVKDIIPTNGVYVMLQQNYWVESEANGRIPVFLPSSKFLTVSFSNPLKADKYSSFYPTASKNYINFILFFLKQHIIVYSVDFINHLNFQSESFGLSDISTRQLITSPTDSGLRLTRDNSVYDVVRTTLVFGKKSGYLSSSAFELFALYEKFNRNKDAFLKEGDKSILTQEDKTTLTERAKYYMIDDNVTVIPINLLFGINVAHLSCFKSFIENYLRLKTEDITFVTTTGTARTTSLTELNKDGYYILREKELFGNEKNFFHKTHFMLNDPTYTIKNLVDDFFKFFSEKKAGGKPRNRRLKSRRMLKKSGYKKTRKYNRKIIK
jgi:hypothetical protein